MAYYHTRGYIRFISVKNSKNDVHMFLYVDSTKLRDNNGWDFVIIWFFVIILDIFLRNHS